MTALDLAPSASPAPAPRRALAHGLTEARLLVRNGEQLLLALVIPIGILVAGRVIGGRFGDLNTLTPSVLALAVWSSAFTSTAIATGFERRYGVLERLAATPLRRSGLLTGKAIAVGLITLGQFVVLAVVGALLGWRPDLRVGASLVALLLVLLGAATFCCLALILAGTLRAEATLALANLIYLVFVVCGAVILPVSRYPAAVQPIITALPTAALGEGLRDWSTGTLNGLSCLIMIIWLAVAAATARKVFSWTS